MKNSYQCLELDQILKQVAENAFFMLSKQKIMQESPMFHELLWQRNLAYLKESMALIQEIGPLDFYFHKDIHALLLKVSKGSILNGCELFDVSQLLSLIIFTKNYVAKAKNSEISFLSDLFNSLVKQETLLEKLHHTVTNDGTILDTASIELKNIRQSLQQIEKTILNTAQDFVRKYSDKVVDQVITNRDNRTLILVKATYKNAFGGYVYGDSASGLASYIEPSSLVNLNNQKINLQTREEEEEYKILKILSQQVQEISTQVMADLDTLEEIDMIFAKANWSLQHEACLPKLNHEKKLYLKKAKHPLIDPKKVVANSYELSLPQHMILITGPNTGGKTVSLKVIALSLLLSACGIGVCAQEANLPFIDNLFVDIGDDQSVVSSLSSFSSHMSKLAYILQNISDKSLVLLDEIGNGTDPKEGEAIAIAILNELRKKECMCFATTHYDRLKAYAKRHEDIIIASVLFDFDTLLPTYQYRQGISGSSNAFAIAKRYGIPEAIVNYAQSLKDQAKSQEDNLIEKLDQQRLLLEKEKDLLQQKKEKFLLQYRELHLKKEELEQENIKFQQEMLKLKKEILHKYEYKARQIINELKNKDLKYHEALVIKNKLINEDDMVPSLSEDNQEFHVGDAVELLSSKQVARVMKVEKKNITIDLHGRKYQVSKKQLRHSLKTISDSKKVNISLPSASLSTISYIPSEINLIGLHVDEAMRKLDDYLDQVKMSNLHQIRIIHGDGSGRLRQAVQQKLALLKTVDHYRLGMPSEGGTGATVVVLKR